MLTILGLILCLVVLETPARALLLGILLGVLGFNPAPATIKKIQTWTLSLSVVGLGAALNFQVALQVGGKGLLLTAILLMSVIGLGLILSRWLGLERDEGVLISVGTAICGGSAIAAMAAVLKPKESAMAVAMGIVFLLNAVALWLLPPLGHYFQLAEPVFGWWAALAIHDTSSVVGATMAYGQKALEVGTTVKLARAMWIVPVTLIASLWLGPKQGEKKRIPIPWFIPAFLLASAFFSFVPEMESAQGILVALAKKGFVLVLFFVGLGISKKTLAEMNVRTLVLGVVLWFFSLLVTYFPAEWLSK